MPVKMYVQTVFPMAKVICIPAGELLFIKIGIKKDIFPSAIILGTRRGLFAKLPSLCHFLSILILTHFSWNARNFSLRGISLSFYRI
jgi:hypothetical protein